MEDVTQLTRQGYHNLQAAEREILGVMVTLVVADYKAKDGEEYPGCGFAIYRNYGGLQTDDLDNGEEYSFDNLDKLARDVESGWESAYDAWQESRFNNT
jgi:hypothetical protein